MVPAAVRRARFIVTYVQPAAVVATWLGLVALGTCCFFAPRGVEIQPVMEDVVEFGLSMAIAGAAAAVTAFAIGDRGRWAFQLAFAVLLFGVVVAVLLIYLLWFDISILRLRMDRWSFERLQNAAPLFAQQVAGYHGPLGAAVGIAAGTTAGLLIRFGRHWPRLATSTALAILILFASGLGRQGALDVVTWLGWKLRDQFVPWSFSSSSNDISMTAMIFGAITGAVVSGLAMYATADRNRRAV
jgi:hypothetical protein